MLLIWRMIPIYNVKKYTSDNRWYLITCQRLPPLQKEGSHWYE
jgi:hypothetical protein